MPILLEDLSKPTENDIIYGESKKNAALIVAKGFRLQGINALPAATAVDGAGNRLYAYFVVSGEGGNDNQVAFFSGTHYLGTDTAKAAGPNAITIEYNNYVGGQDEKISVTYTFDNGKLTPDSNFSKLGS